eukprot:scaffold13983_cov125-Isochrysis_galbana.AAC.3
MGTPSRDSRLGASAPSPPPRDPAGIQDSAAGAGSPTAPGSATATQTPGASGGSRRCSVNMVGNGEADTSLCSFRPDGPAPLSRTREARAAAAAHEPCGEAASSVSSARVVAGAGRSSSKDVAKHHYTHKFATLYASPRCSCTPYGRLAGLPGPRPFTGTTGGTAVQLFRQQHAREPARRLADHVQHFPVGARGRHALGSRWQWQRRCGAGREPAHARTLPPAALEALLDGTDGASGSDLRELYRAAAAGRLSRQMREDPRLGARERVLP